MYQTIQNQTKPNLPIPNQAKLPAGPLSNVTCFLIFSESVDTLTSLSVIPINLNMENCHVRACKNSVFRRIFCEEHLKNPVIDQIKIKNDVSASPTEFKTIKLNSETQISNAIAVRLQQISPLRDQAIKLA